MKVFFLILKCMYLLFPKFIREQYSETIQFYRNILRRIKNNFRYKLYTTSNIKTRILRLNLVKNMNDLNCKNELLFKNENRVSRISRPKVHIDKEDFYKSELHNKVPNIEIYKSYDVSVLGHTDAIILNDNFLHTELNFMEDFHDLKRPDIFLKNEDGSYNVTVNYQNKDYNKKYITLLKEHSINYFHWTTEAIPRLVLILDILKKDDDFNIEQYAVLLDDGLPKQCIDMLNLIVDKRLDLFFIKKGEIFKCEELIYCTPLWHSLDNTRGLPNPKKEFFVDTNALRLVRKEILKDIKKSEIQSYNFKKVYLQRLNNKLRPITNLNKLELLLFKNGFEFIDVGSLDFFEQIELFQSVDIIIGVSGAAFTNLLFMKEGSKAINFYPSTSSTNYYVFQPLADVSGVDLTHFLTIPNEGELSVHSESSIDLEDLELFLKDI